MVLCLRDVIFRTLARGFSWARPGIIPVILLFLLIFGSFISGPQIAKAAGCSTSVLRTTSGMVCGKAKTYEGRTVGSFLGIPYAETTEGDNRWTAPIPKKPDRKVIRALEFGQSCPQKIGKDSPYDHSEDCLSLNIWTPGNSKNRRPVMVFIHGGGFVEGSSQNPVYDGLRMSATTNSVIVTFNYRVGALGFLYGVGGLQGNYGFLDQQLALKWVKGNIASFGGDPNNVTLFGESAGAMSVGLHFVAPDSLDYFDAAILQSNPFALPYRYIDATNLAGRKLQANLGCSTGGVACMRTVPLETIIKHQFSLGNEVRAALTGIFGLLPWIPVIDGKVIVQQPVKRRFSKPVIIGTNFEEGLTFAAILEEHGREIAKWEYEAALNILFGRHVASQIKQFPAYRPIDGDNRDSFANVSTDYVFACASKHVLSRAKGPAYGYQFSQKTSYDVWPGIKRCAMPGQLAKACHGFELPYVFGNAYTMSSRQQHRIEKLTKDEILLSRKMRSYWSAFAASRNPNTAKTPKWPRYSSRNPVFLELDTPIRVLKSRNRNCNFWDTVGYSRTGIYHRN